MTEKSSRVLTRVCADPQAQEAPKLEVDLESEHGLGWYWRSPCKGDGNAHLGFWFLRRRISRWFPHAKSPLSLGDWTPGLMKRGVLEKEEESPSLPGIVAASMAEWATITSKSPLTGRNSVSFIQGRNMSDQSTDNFWRKTRKHSLFRPVLYNLGCITESPGALWKTRMPGSHPQISWSPWSKWAQGHRSSKDLCAARVTDLDFQKV